MKKLLILIQQDPYANLSVSEAIDLAFAAATYDVEVALVFAHHGLVCLTLDHQTAGIKRRSIGKKIKSLPLYGVEKLYALASDTSHIDFELTSDAELINQSQLNQLYTEYDEIQVF